MDRRRTTRIGGGGGSSYHHNQPRQEQGRQGQGGDGDGGLIRGGGGGDESLSSASRKPQRKKNPNGAPCGRRGSSLGFSRKTDFVTSELAGLGGSDPPEEGLNSGQEEGGNDENGALEAASSARDGQEVEVLMEGAGSNPPTEEPHCAQEVSFDENGGLEDAAGNGLKVRESARKGEVAVEEVDSSLMRLRLASMVREPELSEEQLRINDQLQEDELLAVESIFGDNVSTLDRVEELRCFQINVHMEALNGITVTATNDLSTNDENLDGFSYSFNVQHLPPIELTCLFPKSYPSHQPPHFTISVQWLDSARITSLCSKLDSIWMDQPGQEVIYGWVEWLQNSSLSHLGFDGEITLGPYGVNKIGDRRAISGSVSPDVDIPSLKRYNDEQCHEKFLKNLQECCICYSEFLGSDFVKLPCQHFFCLTCMKTFSNMHVAEGTVNKLHCPEAKCGGMIPHGLLKWLLGGEEYERWESFMLQKTLDSMSDIVYCPRCETPCIEDEEQHAQCSKCFFSFCTLCRERRHVGKVCITPEEKLRFLQDRQNSRQLINKQEHKEREMINELLSIKEALRDAKQCPSCKMAISKTEGCNKMECENCGQYFCYKCEQAINGYGHFQDGECNLFPPEELNRWELLMNGHQVQADLFAAGHGAHACPNCRQLNAKVGYNNHILCWACQHHFCCLCKTIVRRFAEHYGPKGCKQHTAG